MNKKNYRIWIVSVLIIVFLGLYLFRDVIMGLFNSVYEKTSYDISVSEQDVGDDNSGNLADEEEEETTDETTNESDKTEEDIPVNVAVVPEAKTIAGVPFTSQAPFGDWTDPRQQHGCEEVSLIMAHYWILGEKLTQEMALSEIVAMSDFENENFNGAYDLSISDTLKLWQEYLGYKNAFVKYDISLEDIKEEIAEGKLIVIPIDGVKLQNPHYTAPGPEFHEMVVIGYDDVKREFITNDPGTKYGAGYCYDYDVFMSSVRDYKTGFNELVNETRRAMLVIEKE
ncbi:MAG: C39 family peptidase [Candidatus Paceibacterota bacterium]